MRRFKCDACGFEADVIDDPLVRCACGAIHKGEDFLTRSVAVQTRVDDYRKPGDALRFIIESRGYTTRSGCGCNDKVASMNRNGLQWCVDNRKEIAGWLEESARNHNWLTRLAVNVLPGMVHDACLDMIHEALELAGYVDDSRIAIITTHWNPSGFAKPVQTYHRWRETIQRKIYVMEVVYRGRSSEIPFAWHLQGDSDSILWQKERLINLAVRSLPKQVKWVAWVDHDLLFENPQWIEQAVVRLASGLNAVQLFDEVIYTDRDGNHAETRPGAAAMLAKGLEPDAAPGGAWMASREWLEGIGGLYDRNVCGGGDATFFQAVTGFHTRYLARQTPALREDCLRYVDRVGGAKWGFVPGSVKHIWHGDKSNRQYVSRDAILDAWKFDPSSHLADSPNRLLSWSKKAPEGLRRSVAEYFENRREDG